MRLQWQFRYWKERFAEEEIRRRCGEMIARRMEGVLSFTRLLAEQHDADLGAEEVARREDSDHHRRDAGIGEEWRGE